MAGYSPNHLLKKGQREPMVMMHHSEPLTDDFVKKFIERCGQGSEGFPGDAQARTEFLEFAFDRWKRDGWGFMFAFPKRFTRGSLGVQFQASLRAPPGYQLSTSSRLAELPKFMRGSPEWALLSASYANLLHTDASQMTWFLSVVRGPLDLMRPHFAFADVDTVIARNMDADGPDPRTLAWPLMIFGPKEVERIGREKLEDAPAWKVEELPYGGIWVQVWENPFDAPQKMVTALGKHLGMDARKG